MSYSNMTLRSLRNHITKTLTAAGVENAVWEAGFLIAHVVKISPLEIAVEGARDIRSDDVREIEKLVARRANREPLSQIMGCREFWSLNFKVNNHVLTPRPDSETLIEAALDHVTDKQAALDLLDLGTGSGCLLLSLLSELPCAQGTGLDMSTEALKVAGENAVDLGLAQRCSFAISDWTSALSPTVAFDIILCNPPYIALGEKAGLMAEVRDFEPAGALFAGQEGLDEYRRLAVEIPPCLKENGVLLLEIGYRQAQAVKDIFQANGATSVQIRPDLGGRDRCLVIKYGKKRP